MSPFLSFKILLILLNALCMLVTSRPPKYERRAPVEPVVPDWREKFLRALAWPCIILRALTWSADLLEILVLAVMQTPLQRSSKILFVTNCANTNLRLTPFFLVGSLLTICGTMLRVNCYRTLGRFFTFELSIQKDAELIITGPYSIVRHPSYSGMILTIIGAIFTHAGGSWVVECGILHFAAGQAFVVYWITVALAVVLGLFLRLRNEDEMLKKQFGVAWIEWARSVPYCLIPGIY